MTDKKLFVLYKDTAFRRSACQSNGYLYMLFGIDSLRGVFSFVESNIDSKIVLKKRQKIVFLLISKLFFYRYSLPFNFKTIWENGEKISNSSHIFCTSDSITLPLVFFLKYFSKSSNEVTCITVGMADKLINLNKNKRKIACSLLNRIDHIVCFSLQEKLLWTSLFIESTGKDFSGTIDFIRFGVDLNFFPLSKVNDSEKKYDVCSIGSDSMRDFDAVYRVAKKYKKIRFCVVMGLNHKGLVSKFSSLANVTLKTNIEMNDIKKVLSYSKITWLPVKENSYTGAFTVMLQSMSTGTPVIVTKVSSNMGGYFLKHKSNIFFTSDNDAVNSFNAINYLLNNNLLRGEISSHARNLVEKKNNINNVYRAIGYIINNQRNG